MSTTENTTTFIVQEAINEEYEWIQYNKQLRLIRSVKDDMYQMQSILTACFAPDTVMHENSVQFIFDTLHIGCII